MPKTIQKPKSWEDLVLLTRITHVRCLRSQMREHALMMRGEIAPGMLDGRRNFEKAVKSAAFYLRQAIDYRRMAEHADQAVKRWLATN